MNKIKEWFSDHLRYFLLIIAAVLVVVIGFFAVKLVTNIGSDKKKEVVEEIEEDSTEAVQPQTQADENLQRDVPEILDIVTEYYTARASKDYDKLESICEVFDEKSKKTIEAQDAAVESYNNLMTYSKAGMNPGEYVVYTYVEVKLTGIDTAAPGLREFYVITGPGEKLLVADQTEERTSYLEATRMDKDVQALREDVDKRMQEAEDSDETLKSFVEASDVKIVEEQVEEALAAENDGQNAGNGIGSRMLATTEVNVRGSASADGALYGTLTTGTEVEILEKADEGWVKIRYSTGGTIIEGYVMEQYLEPAS